MRVPFNNSYSSLPDRFYARQSPSPVKQPGLIRVNHKLANLLDIDPAWLESAEGIATVAGNHIPTGADPIATVYAGHQFGSWNPELGDGRAILLGEVVGTDDERYDIQLKGSGQTPFSRMGDGRAPLGPVLREYIVSEAMAALNIPTSRSLAAASTGELVHREEALPGAVLARVARSHIRIGTVQFFAARDDAEALRLLIDHVITRHYPEAADEENPVLALFDGIMARQARLIADWQMVGFIHGVMNTDNMLLSGETIDYGPCAFMDHYDPAAVFSSIDHGGRYAYRNQPGIAHWNLACLVQALVPLLSDKEEEATELAKEALDRFPDYFLDANTAGLRQKLGLSTEQEGDETLAKDFLDLLEREQKDFTLAFRRLAEISGDEQEDGTLGDNPDSHLSDNPDSHLDDNVSSIFRFSPAFDSWLERWRERCANEDYDARQTRMLATNPGIIPRNHLVEEAITAATYEENLDPFHQLVDILATPYSVTGVDEKHIKPPRPEQIVRQTFCGT